MLRSYCYLTVLLGAFAFAPAGALALEAKSAKKTVVAQNSDNASLRDEIVKLRRSLSRAEADLAAVERLLKDEREARERLERQVGKSGSRKPASSNELVDMRYRSAITGDIIRCSMAGETRLDGDWTPFRDVDFTLVRGEAKGIDLRSDTRGETRRLYADLSPDANSVRLCREARKERCAGFTAKPGEMKQGVEATLNSNRTLKNAVIACRTISVKEFR